MSCGVQVPSSLARDQAHARACAPVWWAHGALSSGLPGNSLQSLFKRVLKSYSELFSICTDRVEISVSTVLWLISYMRFNLSNGYVVVIKIYIHTHTHKDIYIYSIVFRQ